MGEAAEKITLKLLIDKKEKRVIFGEAGKQFVDILFDFLSLPVATLAQLLSKDKTVASLGKIYESIEAMHENYMQPTLNKEHVLNPKISSTPLANVNEPDYNCTVFYRCSNQYGCSHSHLSVDPQAVCPSCKSYMNTKLAFVRGPGKEAAKVEKGPGYVTGSVTYMVMDNLEVKPLLSTISSISLLSRFEVRDLSDLGTLEVCIGEKEVVEMLKASFVTDKVLSSLFLVNHKGSSNEKLMRFLRTSSSASD